MLYDIAVIIAVYNSAQSIEILVNQLHIHLKELKMSYRIVLVNDSSTDNSSDIIDKLSKENSAVTSIHLKNNYGQQNALLCGMNHSKNCHYFVTMDDDMQQPPQIIGELYQTIKDGYDVVYAISTQSHTKFYRQFGSSMRDLFFSIFITRSTKVKVSSFCIISADLADKIRNIQSNFVYISASAFGFPLSAANIYYERNKRIYGKSGYTFKKLFRLYINLFIYYTKIGSIFKPHSQVPSYEIDRIGPRSQNQKKLMVLGGSNCQLNAVLHAQSKGFLTILADYLIHPPASEFSDIHVKISTFDIEACREAAQIYAADGIMTIGSDQPVYSAACIANELHLPSAISVLTAYNVTNKKAMKQIMSDNKIPTVNYCFIDDNSQISELDSLTTPLVIKPVDSQGQRGIYKLDTVPEILDHLKQTLSFSSESEALVEEFYPSDEITVSCWVSDYNLSILSITDRLHYPDIKHIGICTEHCFPSKYMYLYDEISIISKNLINAFNIAQGPLYIQMLIGNAGIKVNELACRIGGAFEDVFIPFLTGFDILDSVINISLGLNLDLSTLNGLDISKSNKQVSVQLLFCKSGIIESMTPIEEILRLPFVISAAYNYNVGDFIPTIENATARFGHCVIVSDEQPIEIYIKQLYEILNIKSMDGDNMILKIHESKKENKNEK